MKFRCLVWLAGCIAVLLLWLILTLVSRFQKFTFLFFVDFLVVFFLNPSFHVKNALVTFRAQSWHRLRISVALKMHLKFGSFL